MTPSLPFNPDDATTYPPTAGRYRVERMVTTTYRVYTSMVWRATSASVDKWRDAGVIYYSELPAFNINQQDKE
jgi:hypothetical protein